MKLLISVLILCFGLCSGFGAAAAQAQSPPGPLRHTHTRKPDSLADRTECVQTVGLCVTVPASWQRLGNVFEDLGFVVAESRPGTAPETRPSLTVAAVNVPAEKKGGGPPSLDSLVDIVLTPGGSFTSETLQRTRLLLNGNEAEIVRVREHNQATENDAIENIALIEGEDGLVYSIALRCAPEEFARLEPVFQKTAHSWHLKQPASEPQSKQNSENK